ncbi:SDR family NAD(P)-dependent oxidoreductase [Natrarchaeobaculum sulfurireducens]|uniref:NDP-sugar epimerase n=1 Tax=Natrarchaeobaculum sulfurireducens TaxID=2044521 RepID=A0A346PJ33_9EURY|nr:SDR family NAD(P)-dependent oxidoreductase [Natrarchaeobaculum sulfurireducens]AXR79528.1 NDP-sugar epimerase [Natrarchaeobaculum sulfurireducens]AXR83301.1 UDP-N-acetylglucosamine 4,6-dehydratase [Natrarchaeobaculum sulfurireducens]
MTTTLEGSTVLVTGGCGSIGSKLVSELVARGPERIRIVDNSEQRLAAFVGTYTDREPEIESVLANVRDKDQLAVAMRDVDIVFHVAAMKHVPMVEDNPYGAVQTNVTGTQNVVEAAADAGVDRLLGVSTDKAANPTSTMGATKLIGERIVSSFDANRPPDDLTLGSVRFGNVVGTEGSVVPLFYEQLRSGGPLTVTDPSMTRFVMRPEDAATFAIDSCLRMDGGEVFVKKMPALRIGDLAEAMREHYAPQFGYDPSAVGIDLVGAKPGERYHEKLVAEDELRYTDEREDYFVLYPQYDELDVDTDLEGEYTSENERLLEHDEIVDLIGPTIGDEQPTGSEEPAASTAGSDPSERGRNRGR